MLVLKQWWKTAAMSAASYTDSPLFLLDFALRGLRVEEVPVRYRPRRGQSKISGTVRGSVRAGVKILRATRRHWP